VAAAAWEADVLPLNYARVPRAYHIRAIAEKRNGPSPRKLVCMSLIETIRVRARSRSLKQGGWLAGARETGSTATEQGAFIRTTLFHATAMGGSNLVKMLGYVLTTAVALAGTAGAASAADRGGYQPPPRAYYPLAAYYPPPPPAYYPSPDWRPRNGYGYRGYWRPQYWPADYWARRRGPGWHHHW
jgi:hypothetical protein